MKKLLFVVLIGLLVSTAAFADHEGFGIGVVGGGGGVLGGDSWGNIGLGWASISLKVPEVPVFWALSFPFYDTKAQLFSIGVSGDYYIFDNNLVTQVMTNEDGNYNLKLDWYLGVGAYFNMAFWETFNYKKYEKEILPNYDFGLRVPVGLSWHIIRQLELYVGVIPGIGFWVGPDKKWNANDDRYDYKLNTHGNVGGEIGLRFWFDPGGNKQNNTPVTDQESNQEE
jgi:hypothetical protein